MARKGKALVGVEAVIDKDRASALLAKEIKSEKLLIATDVEFACTNFGTREIHPRNPATVTRARADPARPRRTIKTAERRSADPKRRNTNRA